MLQHLDLSDNSLTGTIPPEIGNLGSSLSYLDLSSNQLTGIIPPELGNLTLLTIMHLNINNLYGTIPPSIGNLSLLSTLSLTTNNLSGILPPELGNLVSVVYLLIQQNNITGTIPAQIGTLPMIQYLGLDSNSLTGTVPLELANHTWVQLYLEFNNLTCFAGVPIVTSLCLLNDNPWNCESLCCDWQTLNNNWKSTSCAEPCPNITNPISCATPTPIAPTFYSPTFYSPTLYPSTGPTSANSSSTVQQQLDNGYAYVTSVTYVTGNLSIPSNATLQVSINALLTISGCVTINGSLEINLQNHLLHPNQTIQSIAASCFIGTPKTVTITNINKCQQLIGSYSAIVGNLFLTTVYTKNVCNSSSFNTAIIIGVVVGVIGLFIVIAAVIVVVPSLRYRVFPFAKW